MKKDKYKIIERHQNYMGDSLEDDQDFADRCNAFFQEKEIIQILSNDPQWYLCIWYKEE